MDFDVVIVGGGLAGASLAAGLAECGLRLALIERKAPAAPGPEWDSRVYTLTPASIAFLDAIGAWPRIDADRITPIYDMRVFGDDGRSRLDFSAYESGVLQLAATVESGRLHHTLWQGLERQRNLTLLYPAMPSKLGIAEDRVEIGLEDGSAVAAKLAVGADGADSWVRRAAGIGVRGGSYAQLGIVANFACSRAHRNIAYQWFRRDGVLAYLPLPDRRVSIVWSTPEAHGRELLALEPVVLCRRVAEAGGEVLGALEPLTAPAAFPLSRLLASRIGQGRVALIGDAAHVVHPLAGQGVNLGLGDAHVLADLLREAPDPGDRLLLRRFERARAEDILALRWVTDGLFRMFEANYRIAIRIRNYGLNLANSNPVIKTLLARRAVAVGGGVHHKETS
ncbi:MAG TPA: UbiH/UbiF family hydroxylase [Burkholderiales bacterium]|nr:UbiH/UbiF family hydroxylase [Burkholderiales bacterium]